MIAIIENFVIKLGVVDSDTKSLLFANFIMTTCAGKFSQYAILLRTSVV